MKFMNSDVFTLKPLKSKIVFVKSTAVTDLPLPTEQDEIKLRMVEGITSLVKRHLTPDEAKQIIPKNGNVCWVGGTGETKLRGTISCLPVNYKRRVFIQYNESENALEPQAEIRFSKGTEFPGDIFANTSYIVRRDVAGTESERIVHTSLLSENRSKMVLRRLSNNQIVIEFTGINKALAKKEMKQRYKDVIDFRLLNSDQMAMQAFFAELKASIIFDNSSRR